MDKKGPWKEELSPNTRKAFEKAARTAFQYHHRYIGTEHVLFGLLSNKGSAAYKLLEKSPVDVKALLQQTQIVLKSTSHFPDLSNFLGIPTNLVQEDDKDKKKSEGHGHGIGAEPESGGRVRLSGSFALPKTAMCDRPQYIIGETHRLVEQFKRCPSKLSDGPGPPVTS